MSASDNGDRMISAITFIKPKSFSELIDTTLTLIMSHGLLTLLVVIVNTLCEQIIDCIKLMLVILIIT